MKVKLFTLVAVLALLAVFVSQFNTTAAYAAPAHDTQFAGKIQSLPSSGLTGTWKVGGKTVHVNSRTQIDQTDRRAVKGATAQVEGFKLKDGSYLATSIDILGNSPR